MFTSLTLLGLILSTLYTSAPGLRFRNTCPISVMSMRRVSKRTSRRTYKDNVSGMKLGCRAIEKRQSGPEIIRIEHPGLEGWEDPDGVLYYQDFIRFGVKRPVYWPRILSIRVTVQSLQRSTKCLFPPIRQAAAMVRFSSPRSTHKDSILHYKAVKIMIDAPGFAEVILDVVVRHHSLLGPVVTNSSTLYPLETCCRCVIFNAVFLRRSICKPAALPKGQIAASKAYPLSFQCKHFTRFSS